MNERIENGEKKSTSPLQILDIFKKITQEEKSNKGRLKARFPIELIEKEELKESVGLKAEKSWTSIHTNVLKNAVCYIGDGRIATGGEGG